MTGQEIFENYQKNWDEYAQTLMTAMMIVADDDKFFAMLERAEKEGKKISIVELPEDVFGEPGEIEII
jgi:hypothetical protein